MNNDDGRLSLSARLGIAAEIHRSMQGESEIAAAIQEGADLARRWEGAPVAVVSPDDVTVLGVVIGDADHLCGQQVRIVPDMGEGNG